MHVMLQDIPASRHILHNISEDSQEGNMSSNSNNSHMAASAFAAVSHLNDFDQKDHAEQQTAETGAEAAKTAADPTVEHNVEQASSIDKADGPNHNTDAAQHQPRQADSQSTAAANAATPFQTGSVATPPPEPADAAKATLKADARQDSQPSQAGSSPGSHTFDSALHQGVAELVKAPDSAAHTRQEAQGTA